MTAGQAGPIRLTRLPMNALDVIHRIDQSLTWLAETDTMRALREGLLCLIPYLLVVSSFVLASAVLDALGTLPTLSARLGIIHDELAHLMPLLAASAIGYMLSIHRDLARFPVAALCLTYALLARLILESHSTTALALHMPIAIILPLLAVPALEWLTRLVRRHCLREEVAGRTIPRTLNLVLPGIVVGLLVVGSVKLITMFPGLIELLRDYPFRPGQEPYSSGFLFASLNSLLWFFGIHGYYALQALIEQLNWAVVANQLAIAEGRAVPNIMNSAFLGSFVFIGGCGATLGLALAILLLARNRTLRLIALASLPMAAVNVNEILVFGLPIILNFRLFIPFLLAPLTNVALAIAVTQAGWVSVATSGVPFNSPILLNAYVATGGDPHAILLQLCCVLINTALYAPFVLSIDRQTRQVKRIHLPSLDTVYSQANEAFETYASDPIVQAVRKANERSVTEQHLEALSKREFFLAYQPQVGCDSDYIIGCEALLRCRDDRGTVFGPNTFLPWLERAKVMKQVDWWCAGMACQQFNRWKAEGFELPITINVSAETLCSRDAWSRLVDLLKSADGAVSIEITEHALATNREEVVSALSAVQGIGAKIYLDDFGTGYSALSYLNTCHIDVIKIDRSFVLAMDGQYGQMVMKGILDLAKTLDLGVIVEGVETTEQLERIPRSRPVGIQGWLFSKAIEEHQMAEFVAKYGHRICRSGTRCNKDSGAGCSGSGRCHAALPVLQ